ncbi:hypothetical protein, partial [Mesorhizobium sp. LNHC209A00]|uniref:hypothetical protein n=1 Tax=Mesorhizobium sp. LNHC209A00 TaxID=1287226 RepID=UPI001AEBEB4B
MRGQIGSDCQHGGINRRRVDQSGLAKRERTGLVEHRRVDCRQTFHGRAVPNHDAVLEQAPCCDHLDDWN